MLPPVLRWRRTRQFTLRQGQHSSKLPQLFDQVAPTLMLLKVWFCVVCHELPLEGMTLYCPKANHLHCERCSNATSRRLGTGGNMCQGGCQTTALRPRCGSQERSMQRYLKFLVIAGAMVYQTSTNGICLTKCSAQCVMFGYIIHRWGVMTTIMSCASIAG